MAAREPAAGSSQKDPIDLYEGLNCEDGDFDKTAEASDLYDAVLTGFGDQNKKVPSKVESPVTKDRAPEEKKKTSVVDPKSGEKNSKKYPVYVGNFSWWTSERDLMCITKSLGVKDILEIKFAENLANGQSRGYAKIMVSSEESLKKLLDKIPQCRLDGESLNCLFATQQNLAVFETIANQRIPMRVNSKDLKEYEFVDNTSLLSHEPSTPAEPPAFPLHPYANMPPSNLNPFLNLPPPPLPHIPPNFPPPVAPYVFTPPPFHVATQPLVQPSLHLNPAFFPPGHDNHSHTAYNQKSNTPQPSGGDFEEQMERNRTIASSAITKAVSEATTGDLRVATETLLTAISIIKQSRVFEDECCQFLITSLKDCLVSIQGNCSSRRDQDRGHDRDRNRNRDRERSDSNGASRRHREERSWSGERDRMRDRDRHRDYRDRYR